MNTLATHELAEYALRSAGTAGRVVLVDVEFQSNLRWAGNTLTTNGETVTTSVAIVEFLDTAGGIAAGTASGQVRALSDVDALIARARAAASDAGPAEDAGPLPGADGGPPTVDADFTEPPTPTSGGAFTPITSTLGAELARSAAAGEELSGYAEHRVTTSYLATSTGIRRRFSGPRARLECTGKSDARTRSSWAGRAGADFHTMDVSELVSQLRTGLARQARHIDIAPGRHPVILTPSASADLMIDLYWSMIARDAQDGRTVFSRPGGGTRLGEALTHVPVTVSSDPADPQQLAAPFVTASRSSSASSVFDNGLPLGATRWIDQGRLSALIGTRHTAGEAAIPCTPGIDNLRVEHRDGTGNLADLVARTERGLLLTCLWYIREVDPRSLLLTGLTRDGVLVIEDGEIIGAAGNFRFNESPVDLLTRITDASATSPTLPREWADYFTRATMPALLVEDFNCSTTSDAR